MFISKRKHHEVVDAYETEIAAYRIALLEQRARNDRLSDEVVRERQTANRATTNRVAWQSRCESMQATFERFLDDLASGRVGKPEIHGAQVIERAAS